MTYKIEEGIPIPPAHKGGRPRGLFKPSTPLTQTLARLEPSQSVLLDTEEEYRLAQKYADRQRNREYAGRKIPRSGWRIWRIE